MKEDFIETVESLLNVDMTDIKVPKAVTTVSAYTNVCLAVKARHGQKIGRKMTKQDTSSAIDCSEFAFVLARFKRYLGEKGLVDHFGFGDTSFAKYVNWKELYQGTTSNYIGNILYHQRNYSNHWYHYKFHLCP